MQSISEWLTANSSPAHVLLDAALKGTVLMLLALAAVRLLRRSSAAVRHRVWGLMFCGLLILPLLSYALPAWRVPVLPAPPPEPEVAEPLTSAVAAPDIDLLPEAAALPETRAAYPDEMLREYGEFQPPAYAAPVPVADVVVEKPESNDVAVVAPPVASTDRPESTLIGLLLLVWWMGAALVLLPLGWSITRNVLLRIRSVRVEDDDWKSLLEELRGSLRLRRRVDLLASKRPLVPMTSGVVRPVVLLPDQARRWTDRLRRFVLLHELAHVKRWDVGFQLLARVACAVYWFHPLVWYAMRRLRIERELACDDCVLTAGERPADYAEQLLEIARTCRPTGLMAGVAMAEGNSLEQRVRALLDRARSHLPLSRRGAVALLAASMSIVTAVAVVRPAMKESAPSEAETVADALSADPEGPLETDSEALIEDVIILSGRVVDPDGNPHAARVLVVRTLLSEWTWTARNRILADVQSADDGTFSVEFPTTDSELLDGPQFLETSTQIVATADGYAPQWEWVNVEDPPSDVMLALARDSVRIEGRLLDLEGQPLAGVRVRPEMVQTARSSLDDWIVAARNNPVFLDPDGILPQPTTEPARKIAWFPEHSRLYLDAMPFTPEAVTDDDGRFRLTGLGDDRRVEFRLDGPGIASLRLPVVTREFDPLPMPNFDPRFRTNKCFGATFVVSLEPDQPIVGIVRDADSGDPVEGALVLFSQYGESRALAEGFMSTTTGADGRFELTGIPKPDAGDRPHRLRVVPPVGQPYFEADVNLPGQDGLDPVEIDVALQRGIWITGQVTDIETGAPVQAVVSYYPFLSNEHAADFPIFRPGVTSLGQGDGRATDEDGRFRVPGIPGRGVVRVVAAVSENYRRGVGVDAIDDFVNERGQLNLYHMRSPGMGNTFAEVNAAADDGQVECDLSLVPFQRIAVRLVDPNGQPVTGVRVGNRTVHPIHKSFHTYDRPTKSEVIEVVGLSDDVDRALVLHHVERNIGRIVSVGSLNELGAGPVTIELQPCATVTGHITNGENEPLSGIWVDATAQAVSIARRERADGMVRYFAAEGRLQGEQTDADGQFEFSLLPGGTYRVEYGGLPSRDQELVRNLTVEPGEQIDLGTIDVTADPETWPEPIRTPAVVPVADASSDRSADRDDADRPRSYSGQVTNPDGDPIANAHVAVAVTSSEIDGEGSLQAVATTDDQGRFHFDLDPATARQINGMLPFAIVNLVASAAGHGLDWLPLTVFEDQPIASAKRDELQRRIDGALGAGRFPSQSLQLRPEDGPVRGRLVDLEGLPLSNVTILVERIAQPDISLLLRAFEESSKDRVYEALNATSTGERGIDRRQLWQLIPPVTTDANGEFTLSGIGRDQLATLSISGDRVEAQRIHVVGRSMETVRVPHIAHYPNGHKDVFAGREFSFAIGPSIPVEGVVRDFDTGEAIPGTFVYVERLFREGSGNDELLRLDTGYMHSVTDEHGRFRITGMPPGGPHVLNAIPPKSEPYLIASQDVSLSLQDSGPNGFEIRVKKTLWIEGRVTDRQTGEPLDATVDYLALQVNPNTLDTLGLRQGWQMSRYRTDSEGRYRVPGLPGPGVVLARSLDSLEQRGYPRAVGAEDVEGYDADVQYIPTTPIALPLSNWNLVRQIDPPREAASFHCDLVLDAGQSIPGVVIGPDGDPVADFSVIGEVVNGYLWQTRTNGKFAVGGYDGQGPRQLFFKSPDASLVGQFRLEGAAPGEILVTLEPAVRVTGRLIDNETGLPAERHHLYCENSSLGEFRIDDSVTDDEGRFEIKGLIPDVVYEMNSFDERKVTTDRNHFQIDLTDAEPGDVIELGDVTGPESRDSQTSASPNTPKQADATTVSVRGRVVLPDGSPAVGAVVRAASPMYAPIASEDLEPQVTIDDQGRFSVSFSSAPYDDLSRFDERWRDSWKLTTIAASLPGYGGQWVRYDKIEDPSEPIMLKLVEDVPIDGRVIDLEGHPVAGVSVKIGGPSASEDEDLSAWIEAAQNGEPRWTIRTHTPRSVHSTLIGVPRSVTTDEQGRFSIRGVGCERHLALVFESENVAHHQVSVATRLMEPIQRVITPSFAGREMVYGAEFTYTAAPSRPIVGTVRDADTGEPMPSVAVESYKFSDYPYSNHRVLKTVTDEQGHYRLIGMPKGDGNQLLVLPNDDQPYFMRRVDLPDPAGLGAVTVDINVHRGIWITGRITDKVTGEPVGESRVHYLPFRSNEFAQAQPEFRDNGIVDGDLLRYTTKADGTYRLVGLPGPAIIGAASMYKRYREGVGYDAIDGPYYRDTDYLDTYRNPVNPSPKWPNVMAEINPAVDAESVTLDLQMDPGLSVPIRLIGPDDQPLREVDVTGFTSDGNMQQVEGDRFEATEFAPDETRTMLFRLNVQGLGRVARITPSDAENGPVTIQLQPVATLSARLLHEDGSPLTGVEIEAWPLPTGDFAKRLLSVTSDENGHFELTLLPGATYSLQARGSAIDDSYAVISRRLTVEPGEAGDLGDLVLTGDGEFQPVTSVEKGGSATAPTEPEQDDASSASRATPNGPTDAGVTIHGIVTEEGGQPVSDAHVIAIGWKMGQRRGGDLRSHGEIMAETTTDGDGRYELAMPGVSSATHEYTKVLARSESSGLVWRSFDPDAEVIEASFELAPEQPIRMRLIDIEAQPAEGVRLSFSYLKSVGQAAGRSDGIRLWDSGTRPRAWPVDVTTDADGRCVIHHVPADCGVHLTVAGDDRFARQDLAINTGLSEHRGEHDATYRPLVKNVGPGEEAALVLAPAQIVEGVVRYEDTGDPVPSTAVNVWASQQEFGSMISVAGQTDEEGRYRIHPHPGIRFGVMAYPPRGTPYLVRQVSRIPWPVGARVKEVDVTLPRGVLVRGKVVDAGTGQPVVGATVQYLPRADNPHASDDIVTGWQGIQLSEADGAFEIAVLPGAGTLLFHGPSAEYVVQEITSRQIYYGQPGGARYYAHAIHAIDLEPEVEPLELTVELRRGERVTGRVVDESGTPIESALMITRLNISPYYLEWRGSREEVSRGQFDRADLEPGKEYAVYFLDPERQLGAATTLRSDDPAPTIVLRPCGKATARFVNGDGEPREGSRPGFKIVVTPGASMVDSDSGELIGDSDFVANIDRTNHWNLQTDSDGHITYPALIPGATYRINRYQDGNRAAQDFTVEPGETIDLGEIVIDE